MFENEATTRAAICGTGILLGGVMLAAKLPLVLLAIPVLILFLGIVAEPDETHAAWYGMLAAIGIFDPAALSDAERAEYVEKRHYVWFGEVAMSAILAGTIAIPIGMYLAGRIAPALAFACAAIAFLPLFVMLPKLIRQGMQVNPDAAIAAFGRNEQARRIFYALGAAAAGLVLAQVADPEFAKEIVRILAGAG